MPRPPLTRRARHRTDALARVAAAAGVAFLAVSLAACKGGEASNDAVAAPVAAHPPATVSSAAVPPPPDLARLPAEAAPSAAAGGTAGSLAEAHAALDAALARSSRCSADGECRSLAVGGKACGGPTGYAAYSSKAIDPATIEGLAKREHDLALQEARESHRVSNCMMLGDPGARCTAGKCVTGGPSGGNPAIR